MRGSSILIVDKYWVQLAGSGQHIETVAEVVDTCDKVAPDTPQRAFWRWTGAYRTDAWAPKASNMVAAPVNNTVLIGITPFFSPYHNINEQMVDKVAMIAVR